MSEALQTIGIKERELRDMAQCHFCNVAVGRSGIFFYRVKVDQVVMDPASLARHSGLEALTSPVLASILGPGEDLAHRIVGEEKTVCAACLHKIASLLDG